MMELLFVIPTWLIAVFAVLAGLVWIAQFIEDLRTPKSPEDRRREEEERLRKSMQRRLDRDEWDWWDRHKGGSR